MASRVRTMTRHYVLHVSPVRFEAPASVFERKIEKFGRQFRG